MDSGTEPSDTTDVHLQNDINNANEMLVMQQVKIVLFSICLYEHCSQCELCAL